MSLNYTLCKTWQFIIFVGSKEFNKKKSKLPLGSSATAFNFKKINLRSSFILKISLINLVLGILQHVCVWKDVWSSQETSCGKFNFIVSPHRREIEKQKCWTTRGKCLQEVKHYVMLCLSASTSSIRKETACLSLSLTEGGKDSISLLLSSSYSFL